MSGVIPMQLGTAAELETLRAAFCVGVFLGVPYGVLRVVRRLADNRAVTFLCDLLFAGVFGVTFAVTSLYLTDYYRGFVAAAMAAGTVLWSVSAGRIADSAAAALISLIYRRVLKKIFVGIAKIMRATADKFVNIHINSQKTKKMQKTT